MYKGIIAYDGTRYFGWQKTKEGPSIQEELEKAILKITGEKTLPEAASRTDKGVHAQGQVIQFRLQKEKEPSSLLRSLNAVLPSDVRIFKLFFEEFHPTLDAIGKEYHYHLCQEEVQDPFQKLYAWHVPFSLDPKKMEQAIQDLLGTHDFTAFANEKPKNPICTLESILFLNDIFQIKGDRFLYKMVRNLVGTLFYIGIGKLKEDSIPFLLASQDRSQGGITAPAHGLYLHQVFYPLK